MSKEEIGVEALNRLPKTSIAWQARQIVEALNRLPKTAIAWQNPQNPPIGKTIAEPL